MNNLCINYVYDFPRIHFSCIPAFLFDPFTQSDTFVWPYTTLIYISHQSKILEYISHINLGLNSNEKSAYSSVQYKNIEILISADSLRYSTKLSQYFDAPDKTTCAI